MHLSLFFSLSFRSFVLYLCILTLAVSSSSSGTSSISARYNDHIACPGPLPDNIPDGFLPHPQTLLQLCASKERYERNMRCTCMGELFLCGTSRNPSLQSLIQYCLTHCQCGPNTRVLQYTSTEEINYASSSSSEGSMDSTGRQPSSRVQTPTGSTHTCKGTCTSVSRGCASQSIGDCTCFAPPVSLFYWHLGDCGTRLPFKAKRDLAQQRHSYLNATARFASTAAPAPPSDLAAQLASGLLPSPCNASYVSFACSDSPDGIVHEPPQNWLGALLPEGAKESSTLPPVPETWLRIHGEEGKSQKVLKVAVD